MGNKTASVTATIAIRFRDRDNTYRAPRNHPRPFKYFIPFRIENFNWGNSTTRFPTRGNFSVACHARLLSIFPLAFHFHPPPLSLLLPSLLFSFLLIFPSFCLFSSFFFLSSFLLSFFFQLCAEVWNDALWKSRIWLNDIPTKKRNGTTLKGREEEERGAGGKKGCRYIFTLIKIFGTLYRRNCFENYFKASSLIILYVYITIYPPLPEFYDKFVFFSTNETLF